MIHRHAEHLIDYQDALRTITFARSNHALASGTGTDSIGSQHQVTMDGQRPN